jgi:hypothetical protein
MKRRFFAVVLLFTALSVYGQSREVTLDDAIQNAASQIQNDLSKGSTIIVYQFQSHNARISDYVLKELFDKFVNSRKFIVLDRGAQEVVNAELDFQFNKSAGMISDESLASLTKRIGAEAIITGSLDDTGNDYRFRVRVIGTETIAAIVSYTVSVNKNDKRVAGFSNRQPDTAEKIGTGALNILLGLGSYLERDIAGGITITAGYAIAAGLFVVEAAALDWDNPMVGIPATAGVAVAGLAFVYGFARPFIYNRSPQTAAVMDNTQFKIVQARDAGNGALALQLSYSVKFFKGEIK